MDFYCSECDMLIQEEDVVHWNEPSEYFGRPVCEHWVMCPSCGEPVSEYMGEPYKKVFKNPFGDTLRGAFKYD